MLAQLECPKGQTQALHRQRLVLVLFALALCRHRPALVLLAAPPTTGAPCAGAPPRQQVEVSRVVDASGVASWVLYRQCLVQTTFHVVVLRHHQRLVHSC